MRKLINNKYAKYLGKSILSVDKFLKVNNNLVNLTKPEHILWFYTKSGKFIMS